MSEKPKEPNVSKFGESGRKTTWTKPMPLTGQIKPEPPKGGSATAQPKTTGNTNSK